MQECLRDHEPPGQAFEDGLAAWQLASVIGDHLTGKERVPAIDLRVR